MTYLYLIDINPIEVDEYLDFILENKSIKSYINESRVRDLILTGENSSATSRR